MVRSLLGFGVLFSIAACSWVPLEAVSPTRLMLQPEPEPVEPPVLVAGFGNPFEYYDQNGDGYVSPGEYFNRRRTWFSQMDEDQDGVIHNACGVVVEAVTFERCTEHWSLEFGGIAGGDGMISFEEYLSARSPG